MENILLEEVNSVLTQYHESTESMRQIIDEALMLPREWDEESFFKYSIMMWFVNKGIYFEQSNGAFRRLIPDNWPQGTEFEMKLRDTTFKLKYASYADGVLSFTLMFERPRNKIVSRSVSRRKSNLLDPRLFRPGDCLDLMISFNSISGDLASSFLIPFIVPASEGDPIKSR